MKLREAFSLTALLAGTSLGLAQEAPMPSVTTQAGPAVSKTPEYRSASFMDHVRSKKAVTHYTDVATPNTQGSTVVANHDMMVDCRELPAYTFYGRAEYLLWRLGTSFNDSGTLNMPAIRPQVPFIMFTRSIVVPATDEPPGVTTNEVVNVYGLVNIQPVLFAGSNLEAIDRNGMRLTLGGYLDGGETAFEATWFQLERRESSFTALAASNITLANGLTDLVRQPEEGGVRPPPEAVNTVFSPLFTDTITGTAANRFYGLELNLRRRGYDIWTTHFEWILGMRYVNFDEQQSLVQVLGMQDATYVGIDNGGIFVPGVTNFTALLSDQSARNRFLGVQAGVMMETKIWNFFASATAKMAVGGMNQETQFNENIFTLGATAALPPTIYPYPTFFRESRTRLSWVPELTGTVGYDLGDSIRLSVGYNALWAYRVIRPVSGGPSNFGNGTISLIGTSSAVRGPALTNFQENKIVAHGLNFGIEIRY